MGTRRQVKSLNHPHEQSYHHDQNDEVDRMGSADAPQSKPSIPQSNQQSEDDYEAGADTMSVFDNPFCGELGHFGEISTGEDEYGSKDQECQTTDGTEKRREPWTSTN